jgi:hypothetical protein
MASNGRVRARPRFGVWLFLLAKDIPMQRENARKNSHDEQDKDHQD